MLRAKGCKTDGAYISSFEASVYRWFENNACAVIACILICVGLAMRACGWSYTSRDYTVFLGEWYSQIQAGGLHSLATQVGNYNMPYQEIIAILTYLPFSARTAYKLVSCIFDVALAIGVYLLVQRIIPNSKSGAAILAGAVAFTYPTVVMNSAWWAQCDSIWASFCLFSIVAYIDRKYVATFVLYGVALAFKLQAIFLMPFWLISLVRTKQYSVSMFLLIPVTMVVLSLPSIFAGRNVMDIINVYQAQAGYEVGLYCNYPSFWGLFVPDSKDYSYMLRPVAILITIAFLAIEGALLVLQKADLSECTTCVKVVAMLTLTAVFFLPGMHERYAFFIEVLLLAVTFSDIYFAAPAVVLLLLSMKTYLLYIFSVGQVVWDGVAAAIWPLSILNGLALAVIIVRTFMTIKADEVTY